MGNINEIYQSRYIKASQLDGDWELTIKDATPEEIKGFDGQPTTKLILGFEEIEQRFPLSPTNASLAADLLGNDYDQWVGKTLLLGVEKVKVGNELKDAIRIKRPLRVTKPQPKQVVKPPAKPVQIQSQGPDDAPF